MFVANLNYTKQVLFAAKVAYQAALVEAQQRSWLDGPRAKKGPVSSPFKHLLQNVDWIPQLSLDDEAGGRVGAGGAGGGRGAFSLRGGVLGAAVMGLGEDIGGSANGMVLRVHDTITEQVHEVTSNVKENVARSVDNVKQVGEAVVEGVAPILESRWQVLQLGCRFTGEIITYIGIYCLRRSCSSAAALRALCALPCPQVSLFTQENIIYEGNYYFLTFQCPQSRAKAPRSRSVKKTLPAASQMVQQGVAGGRELGGGGMGWLRRRRGG